MIRSFPEYFKLKPMFTCWNFCSHTLLFIEIASSNKESKIYLYTYRRHPRRQADSWSGPWSSRRRTRTGSCPYRSTLPRRHGWCSPSTPRSWCQSAGRRTPGEGADPPKPVPDVHRCTGSRSANTTISLAKLQNPHELKNERVHVIFVTLKRMIMMRIISFLQKLFK